jgi:uncharacterized membrane protein YdjX (TVP38/TMEM64 family)
MLSRFRDKLSRLAAALPVLAGALAVAALLAALAWVGLRLFPNRFLETLAELPGDGFEANRDALKAFFLGWGDRAAWVFLLAQFLQVVLAPIPGQLVGMLGGFVFGFWPGLALNVVGNALGSATAMAFTRLFGERVMRPFVSPALQERFDRTMTRGGLANFFMLFLLPGTPKDSICFMAGLTRFGLAPLLAVNTLGRLPGLAVLTFAGAALDTDLAMVKIVFGAGMLLALAAWFFDEEIKERLHSLWS